MSDAWWVQLSFLPPSQLPYYNGLVVLAKNVFFSAHMCMQCTAYILLHWQVLCPVETADNNPFWAQFCCDYEGEESQLKFVCHQRSSFIKGCLPPNVIFHWRSFDWIQFSLIQFRVWHSSAQPSFICLIYVLPLLSFYM